VGAADGPGSVYDAWQPPAGRRVPQEERTMATPTPDQVRMTVFGMTCEACARCVRQTLEAAGAREVRVDVDRKEATFALPAGVAPPALRDAVRARGYLPGRIEPRPRA
jgi:copper chaperone CopZ